MSDDGLAVRAARAVGRAAGLVSQQARRLFDPRSGRWQSARRALRRNVASINAAGVATRRRFKAGVVVGRLPAGSRVASRNGKRLFGSSFSLGVWTGRAARQARSARKSWGGKLPQLPADLAVRGRSSRGPTNRAERWSRAAGERLGRLVRWLGRRER